MGYYGRFKCVRLLLWVMGIFYFVFFAIILCYQVKKIQDDTSLAIIYPLKGSTKLPCSN